MSPDPGPKLTGGLTAAIEVIAKYILPLVFVVVGFVTASYLGGSAAISNLLITAVGPGSITAASANRLGGLVMVGLWGIVGIAFWRLGSRDGVWYKVVGRSIGAFFFGAAAGNLVPVFTAGGTSGGLIGQWVSGAQTIAQGG